MVNLKKRLNKTCRMIVLAVCALLVIPAMALQLKDNAPQTYTVKKGDTLWGIASVFLNEPWLWPELWRTNTQINNPHLIYPGDVITVGFVNGEPVLSVTRDKPSLVLSPNTDRRVKSSPIDVLDWSAIAPFIKQHTFLDETSYDLLPKILGNQDGNVRFASDDYVLGEKQISTDSQYRVVRKQDTITNLQGEILGVQVTHVSTASSIPEGQTDNAMLLFIDDANQEARRGDKLLEGGFDYPDNLTLKPSTSQRGHVVGDLHDHNLLGKYDVVIVDLGAMDVEPGTVMGLYVQGPDIIDETTPRYVNEPGVSGGGAWFNDTVMQPAMKVGEVIIFKTFDAASYGLITRASKGVKHGFIVANP
ncbi:LysM peptidoglycan-binding domain-containing protein [Alteromonas gracilis]|uniref:LysM peptidoglycan-binding domain-containing protein n=1 Tax=Alteromonas gracilis TaxID=1479524 RepID=UPI0030CED8AA